MKFERDIETFLTDYLKEMSNDSAAIFAGAGLSAGSGHVDWKGLLADFAEDLGLDIDKETDLISLTQYHLNKNALNRSQLTKKIVDEFHHGTHPNQNHRILARLPISTYWTTNYDKLIETSLKDAGKIVDVKYTTPQLATTVNGRDVTLYKMHGDVEHPNNTILSKDEYEKYHQTHAPFISALGGDLLTKTFLFIGFSFTDPNLDYVLSRIRVTYQQNQRHHYCIFREVKKENGESEAAFSYRQLKQELAIEDLKRFNIRTLIVKEYPEITLLLAEIENRFKQRTIYISGSAEEYGVWDKNTAEKFISSLSKKLIQKGFKIVSGFGLGVGSAVITGALEEIYLKKDKLREQLVLRPFPQGEAGEKQWDSYRNDMISYSGISIFIFGNKLKDKNIVSADGVRKEFEIAKKLGNLLLPIGATGYVAEELWSEVITNFDYYYPNSNSKDILTKLGAEKEPEVIVSLVVEFLAKINR